MTENIDIVDKYYILNHIFNYNHVLNAINKETNKEVIIKLFGQHEDSQDSEEYKYEFESELLLTYKAYELNIV